MKMLTTKPKKTVADYQKLPEEPRCELFDGEFFMSPSPTPAHQRIIVNLVIRLTEFVRSRRLGEVLVSPLDCVLSEYDVAQPDVLFVSNEHLSRIQTHHIAGPPDLAIEVLSKGHQERDRIVKRDLYAKSGVREYWIVDPEAATIEVFALGLGAFRGTGVFTRTDVLASPLLSGLELPVSGVFS